MRLFAKPLSYAALVLGMTVSQVDAQALNAPDIYLSIADKEAHLPSGEASKVSVNIGNGLTSQPTSATTLTVSMDRALAVSLGHGATNWASASLPGVVCAPLNVNGPPTPAPGAQVVGTCSIPALSTGQSFTLDVNLVGQAPWSQYYIGFKLDKVTGEVFTDNQDEEMVVTSVEVADLSLATKVSKDGVLLETVGPNAIPTIPGLGAAVYDFAATVTNHGPNAVDKFVVTIPVVAGFSQYQLPPSCVLVTVSGTPAYNCEITQKLAKGQSFTLDYSAEIDPLPLGGTSVVPMNNIVSLVDGPKAPRDFNGENNSVEMLFGITAGGDVSVKKKLESAKATIVIGDEVTYSITPNYLGTSPGLITVRDFIPLGFTPVVPEGCTFDTEDAPRELICEVEVPEENVSVRTDLPAITLKMVYDGTDATTFANTATVSVAADKTAHDTNTGNNTSTAVLLTVEEPRYDLEASKARFTDAAGKDKDYAIVGEAANYKLGATNTGNMPLQGPVTIIDHLPRGLAYKNRTGNDWTCTPKDAAQADGLVHGPTEITCVYDAGTPGLLPNAATPPLTLNTIVVGYTDENGKPITAITNNISTEWTKPGEDDPWNFGTADNKVTISFPDQAADLSLTKTVEHATRAIGEWQTYVLRPTNNGHVDDKGVHHKFAALDVTVQDRLENLYEAFVPGAGASVVLDQAELTAIGANCSLTPNGTTAADLSCTFASLPYCTIDGSDGTPVCPAITVKVRQGAIGTQFKGVHVNEASIASTTTPESDYGNNTAKVSHDIAPRFNVSLAKVSNQLPEQLGIKVGERFRYTITVTNHPSNLGKNDYTATPTFKIVDTLPANIHVMAIDVRDATGGAKSDLVCPAPSTLSVPTKANEKLECTLNAPLAVGASRTIIIEAVGTKELIAQMTGDPRKVVIDNTAKIEFTGTDGTAELPPPGSPEGTSATADNVDNALVTMIEGKYDLAITKTVVNPYLKAGDLAEFRLRVTNVGLLRAENAVVLDGLPSETLFQFKSAYIKGRETEEPPVVEGGPAPARACSIGAGHSLIYPDASGLNPINAGKGRLVSCNIGNIDPDEVVEIIVKGIVLTAGSEKNHASVSAHKDLSTSIQDDYNYRNNHSYTSVTAQEMVDLKLEKRVKPSTGGDNRFTFREGITFVLDAYNQERRKLTQGETVPVGDYSPYFTDASRVVLSDTLPTGLAYVGTAKTFLNGVEISAGTPGYCAPPAADATTFSCTNNTLANGARLIVELPTKVTATGCTGTECKTDGNQQYIELTNKAALVSDSFEHPENTPNEAEVTVEVLLSSISGHYWWDLKNNKLDSSSNDWAFVEADGDKMIPGMTLILQVQNASGAWVESKRTQTDADGFYEFTHLPPGLYRIIDGTTFQDGVTTVDGQQGVLGAVTKGNIPLQNAGDFGTSSSVPGGGNLRGIGDITLGDDRHGVEYNLRIVPVPVIDLTKDITNSVQSPNGVLVIDYRITVTNGSMEPLMDVKLQDDLSSVFGPLNQKLQDATLAQRTTGREFGTGVNYALGAVSAQRKRAGSADSAVGIVAGFNGSGSNIDVLSGVTLGVGERIEVSMQVVVNLGQPAPANSATDYTNTASVTGKGQSTEFEYDPTVSRPTQDGGDRKTPTLKDSDTAETRPDLTSAITLDKQLVRRSTLGAAYDGKLVYKFVITNTGKLPIANIVLEDTKLGDSTLVMDMLFTNLAEPVASRISQPGKRPALLDLMLEGEELTLYAVYELSDAEQTALAAGALVINNTASVTGDSNGPVTDDASVSTTTNLAIVKTARLPHARPLAAGDIITYDITVTNTGNIDLQNAFVRDAKLLSAAGTITATGVAHVADGFGPFTLAAGQPRTFTAAFTYVVTQADIDAVAAIPGNDLLVVAPGVDNKLVNTASVSGEFVPGVPVTRQDDETVPLRRAASFTVAKTAHAFFGATTPPTAPVQGDKISYAIVISNTGNTDLRQVTLNDALVGISNYVIDLDGAGLAPGQKILLHGADLPAAQIPAPTGVVKTLIDPRLDLTLTWAQIEALSLTNTAQVTATPPGKTPVTETGRVTTPLPANPAIALEKTVSPDTPLTFDAAGVASHPVTYSFKVTNTGNVPLSSLQLTDPLLRRTIDVSAAISAANSGDGKLYPETSFTVTLPDYEFRIDPTGTLVDGAGQPYATYATLVAGLDAGQITNTATVTGRHGTSVPTATDEADLPVTKEPRVTIDKVASNVSNDGRTLTWTITVKNTGSMTLAPLSVTDTRFAGLTSAGFNAQGVLTIASLAPQQSRVITVSGNPTTLAERDQGFASNTASVTTTPPGFPPVTETDTEEPKLHAVTGIEIIKSDNPVVGGPVGAPIEGDSTVTYEFWIRNTGSVGLSDLTFTDPLLGLTATKDGVAPIAPGSTPPGYETAPVIVINTDLLRYLPPAADYAAFVAAQANPADWPALVNGMLKLGSVTWPLKQEWIDAGEFTNAAHLTGNPPPGVTDKDDQPPGVPDDSGSVRTPFDPEPAFTAVKTGKLVDANGNDIVAGTPSAAGDLVEWSITVTNTGNVTLGEAVNGTPYPFTLTETGLTGLEWLTTDPASGSASGDVWTLPALAPRDSVTITLRSQVTAADILAGKAVNTAIVAVTHPSGPVDPQTPRAEVPLVIVPGLNITKTLCAAPDCTAPAGKMRFVITVTNTGNAVLDTLVVKETAEKMEISTEGGFNAATDTLDANKQIFTRTAPFGLGASLTLYADYTLISDADFAAGNYEAADLAYMNAGRVLNTAEASATYVPPGTTDRVNVPDPDPVEATGPLTRVPGVQIVKTVVSPVAVNGEHRLAPATLDSVVTYELTVTNTGNVTLTDLVVEDALLSLSETIATLAPGQSVRLSTLVAVDKLQISPTQAQLDANLLPNTATVTAQTNLPDTPEVGDDDTAEVVLVPETGISLVKTGLRVSKTDPAVALDPTSPAAPGDRVKYSFTITNTGKQTLNPVVLKDPLFGATWEHSLPDPLAPGAEVTVEQFYLLTAVDIERGWVFNKAAVEGAYTDPEGQPQKVTDEDDVLLQYTVDTQLELVKTADDSALTTPPEPGQLITYSFRLINSGHVTAKNIDIHDVLPGLRFTGTGSTLAELAPGAEHIFTATYPLRQSDLDAGEVKNKALASSSFVPEPTLPPEFVPPPGFQPNPPTPAPDVPSTPEQGQLPEETVTPLVMKGEFTARKSANLETVYLGDSITYQLTFESQSTGLVRDMHFIDQLPRGLVYTPDSSEVSISGVPLTQAEPVVSGRRLDWGPIDVPRQGVVTITFRARVSGVAPYGKLTNETWSETPTGEKTSNTATATVIREPEHVFECSDVTGKVFEDFNHNGRQDPLDRSAITDQDYFEGKWGKYETMPKEPRGEMGMPHVRLVTPTGTVITTDAHGRYSVPCAELPRDLGSNFTLKLDTRSLPTGYRVTTENPRTLRLTAGKAAQMNFGVAMSKLVRLDLGAAAFVAGRTEASAALDEALRGFAATAADEPLVIHLGYLLQAGEDRALARARLDAVAAKIQREWTGRRANLLIERSLDVSAQ